MVSIHKKRTKTETRRWTELSITWTKEKKNINNVWAETEQIFKY